MELRLKASETTDEYAIETDHVIGSLTDERSWKLTRVVVRTMQIDGLEADRDVLVFGHPLTLKGELSQTGREARIWQNYSEDEVEAAIRQARGE